MKSTYRLQSSLYCVVLFKGYESGPHEWWNWEREKKNDKIYGDMWCRTGKREREEISVKTPIMHSNTTFFSGCLLDTCVDPHKRVISFYHLLKKYIKREDNLISHSTWFFSKCKKWDIAMLNEEDGVWNTLISFNFCFIF